jgi:hypothetical protein
VVNSIAAQEFGSDFTDPYLVRSAGLGFDLPTWRGVNVRVQAASEWQRSLEVNAVPVTGSFELLPAVPEEHVTRIIAEADRPASLWLGGFELNWHAQFRAILPGIGEPHTRARVQHSVRGAVNAGLEKPFGSQRLVMTMSAAATDRRPHTIEMGEQVFIGGPISAPGYDYHSLVTPAGATAHVEWRIPAPFPSFSLGRYGRVPARGTFAPYLHAAIIDNPVGFCSGVIAPGGGIGECRTPAGSYPSAGAAYILPFDLLRLEVARGLARTGRWMFYVDVTREFWSIL